ncbi:hypothetical protein [Streptosporangium sp. NPDC051022]|uniref:hypothetical protein n=1 Tax=Streptosporangium sp. NPDC051022 TaxID=3155752 RepID=UPI003412D7AF
MSRSCVPEFQAGETWASRAALRAVEILFFTVTLGTLGTLGVLWALYTLRR